MELMPLPHATPGQPLLSVPSTQPLLSVPSTQPLLSMPSTQPPERTYGNGEGAVDEGGPTGEYLRLLMRAIHQTNIFEGHEKDRQLSLDTPCK
ncbi:hypothetical protein CRENBAI_011148 [Crenichthys baileyi]|uniref:Uncharacterized protein n=1 Tax=Crenichthys baileyi TaxID=28760 RepID=A0AAV9RMB0_9TELE